MLALLKSDQDLAIEGAYGGAVAKGKIERLRGAADIVENEFDFVRRYHVPELFFHAAENQFAVFQPGARGRPHVQAKLAGIHAGKKVAAYKRQQHESRRDDSARQEESDWPP